MTVMTGLRLLAAGELTGTGRILDILHIHGYVSMDSHCSVTVTAVIVRFPTLQSPPLLGYTRLFYFFGDDGPDAKVNPSIVF